MSLEILKQCVPLLGEVIEIRPECELIEDPELYGIESIVCCVNDYVIGREPFITPGFVRDRKSHRYVVLHPETWMEYGNHCIDWKPVKKEDARYCSEQSAIGAAIGLVFAEQVSLHGFASEIAT